MITNISVVITIHQYSPHSIHSINTVYNKELISPRWRIKGWMSLKRKMKISVKDKKKKKLFLWRMTLEDRVKKIWVG